jgi:hypothetical protein
MNKTMDAIELDNIDSQKLGYEIGRRYRIWTGDIDLVLGYKDGWVIVQDEKTGRIRSHLTRVSSKPLD